MNQETAEAAFIGAKVALFVGERLLVILRDAHRDIPWPGMWDLPGGGREAGERPEEVVIRETFEEVGLHLSVEDLIWKRDYVASNGKPVFFFVAHLDAGAAERVVFGEEGQRWELWSVDAFMADEQVVPFFKTRLADYLHDHHGS